MFHLLALGLLASLILFGVVWLLASLLRKGFRLIERPKLAAILVVFISTIACAIFLGGMQVDAWVSSSADTVSSVIGQYTSVADDVKDSVSSKVSFVMILCAAVALVANISLLAFFLSEGKKQNVRNAGGARSRSYGETSRYGSANRHRRR